MCEEKKGKQLLSQISNEELTERAFTPINEWIEVPKGMSAVEYFLQNNKEIKEAYEKRNKDDKERKKESRK